LKIGSANIKKTGQVSTKRVLFASLSMASIVVLYNTRTVWLPFFNKERIQTSTIQLLERFRQGNEKRALLQYAGGMACWEMIGLSTIPVETAAGMVFGWKGAVASGIGKLAGALAAFLVAQVFLQERLRLQLSSNPIFALLLESNQDDSSASTSRSPWQTSFCLKFSCVPELVKNCGSAVLNIPWWIFLTVTIVHGWSFTALWTWMGVDAARQLQATAGQNLPLQISVGIAMLIGIVGSPLLMAWWIRDLRRTAQPPVTPAGRLDIRKRLHSK
jgi:uncharacterized membrane protein YdjX (TVP38/TMEM64 family)